VKDFDRVVAASRKNRRRYLPFQNSRFYPFFQKMLEVIQSGKLGRIVYIRSNWSGYGRRWDWQTRQEYWGGNLLNTGPHPVDHAIVLFGGGMPKVFARLVSENPFGDADNFTSVTLYGRNRPTIEIVLNSFQVFPQGDQYNVSGTFGGLAGNAAGLKWKYFDPAAAPKHVFKGDWSDKRQYCREDLPWIEESWAPKPGDDSFATLSRAFYDNVYDVLVNGASPVIAHEQVRRQVAVMEECLRQSPMPRSKQRCRKK
jgi:scyllo-inositol 2-dehydrogenase (NADP+)